MQLSVFVAKHGLHPPRIQPSPDEARLLSASDGVGEITAPPASGPTGAADDTDVLHLWVFRADDIPYVIENAPDAVPSLVAGKAKHTNLTGGANAACGGELWIDTTNRSKLYVNGASGRYGPRSPSQLEDAINVFRGLGFEVASCGWDPDSNRPFKWFYR